MIASVPLWIYSVTGILIVAIDRLTKWFTLNYLEDVYHVMPGLSFDLVMNRGISWSLFHSTNSIVFLALSFFIAIMIVCLAIYTLDRWYQNYAVWGEVFTLAGAVSNFVDRIIYGGVIDFVVVSCGDWSWPVFNIADCFIVVGIGMMVIALYRSS